MKFENLDNELNNANLKFDNAQLVFHFISQNLYKNYFNRAILRTQLELIELYKGKTGTELTDSVDEKMREWMDKFEELHKTDFAQSILDFSDED